MADALSPAAVAAELVRSSGVDECRSLYLIGGGGKTTLMGMLARGLAAQGRRVLCATSTRILVPPEGAIEAASGAELVAKLRGHPAFADRNAEAGKAILTAGAKIMPAAEHEPGARHELKLVGLPAEELDVVAGSGGVDALVVEADGSRGRSLKAHAAWEPVVSPRADLLGLVVGGDIVGAPLDEAFVQRASLLAQRLGLPLGAELSCADVVAQLKHPLGYTRCLPAGSRCVVFVSKAQAPRAAELAEAIAAAGFEVILGEWVRPPYIVRRLGG